MEDTQILKTANTILSQLTVPRRVRRIEDVNADMFITLYEGLCGETIPDLILPSSSEENEIHNMQCVIDSLALDVLHTSLAHIVGQDVVRGRRMSIINLLDIFSGLLEYILDGIEKDETSDETEPSKDADAINQSVLSDAVRRGLTEKTNRRAAETFDENTEELIALGTQPLKSPTASPSSKKSRRSGENSERRRSKRATPQAIAEPIASSSMQSLVPASCTESESDASTKPSAGRALSFSKVPAEFSPTSTKQAGASDATFTKPRIAHKLADEMLKTGESTRELMALGDTPVLRSRTRSATKTSALELDKPHEKGELNLSNNARKASKRSRQPKRHVSFISDRTINDDTLAGVPTPADEPRRVDSEPSPPSIQPPHRSDEDRLNLSMRLTDYFDNKEANGGYDGDSKHNQGTARAVRTNQADDYESSPLTHSSEYQTAIEKSASLYNRVTALRNAASDKLESLRTDSVSERFQTVAGDDLSTTEYLPPATRQSDYARGKGDPRQADGAGPSSTGGVSHTASAPSLSVTRNLSRPAPPHTAGSQASNVYKTVREETEYLSARQQTNIPDSMGAKATLGVVSTDSYATARTRPESERYHTAHSEYVKSKDKLDSEAQYVTAKPSVSGRYRSEAASGSSSSAVGSEYKTAVDYLDTHSTDGGLPRSEQREPQGYRRPDWRSGYKDPQDKKVRFNEKRKSRVMIEAVQRTLDEEKWRERLQQKLLSRQYKDDLSDMVQAHRERLEEEKSLARIQDKEFATNVQRLSEVYGEKQTKSQPVCSAKGFLLPKSRVLKKKPSMKTRSATATHDKAGDPLDPADDNFLPNLMEEFPHLYLAPETIKQMWTDHQQQSATINKCLEEDKRKKCRAKTTIEDAEKRQALLMNIMQKELNHTKRLKQMRDKENAEIESKRKQRDVRVQSARVKQYYDDYATRMKSSMLKNKTKEEQLFKRLFAEGLKVQKERMHTLRNYAREQRDKRAHKQHTDVASLENFYKDQFTMLAESVSQERRNIEVRDAAQAKVLDKMKMELRKKMEKDIKGFQEQLRTDEDDYYFRQLDAEKVVQQLNMSRYQTGI